MKTLIALALCTASAAFAHGSSHPPTNGGSGGSIVAADLMPRSLVWPDDRLWQSTEGVILVCPFGNTTGDWRDKSCLDANKKDRWIPLQQYTVPGHVLVSYEHRYYGSSSHVLIAYYGPPTALVQTDKLQLVHPTFTGPVTIEAKTVILKKAKPAKR